MTSLLLGTNVSLCSHYEQAPSYSHSHTFPIMNREKSLQTQVAFLTYFVIAIRGKENNQWEKPIFFFFSVLQDTSQRQDASGMSVTNDFP